MGANFREKLARSLEIIFVVLNFVPIYRECAMTLDFVQQIVKFVGGKFRDSSVDHENNPLYGMLDITFPSL